MKCTACGNELRENAKFCDKCGNVVAPTVEIAEEIKNKSAAYQMGRETALKKTAVKSKRKGHGCLIGILVFVAIVCGLVLTLVYNADNLDSSYQGKLAKAAQATEEQGAAINALLSQCGIDSVTEATHDELLDHDGLTGYRITANGVKNIIVYMNTENQIVTIKYADYIFCNNGVAIDNINNYLISDSEKSNLQWMAQEAVKSVLNSPSSAEFPLITEWAFGKDREKITVQSYVDAQNSFGIVLRSDFQVTFTPDGSTITSVIIDGTEYYK